MEDIIQGTIDTFALELIRLNDHKPGCNPELSLKVKLQKYGGLQLSLCCEIFDGQEYHTIRGASLDEIMVEVNRRLGYADIQIVRQRVVEQKLNQAILPPPAPQGPDEPDANF
jgi:hypothetical protein